MTRKNINRRRGIRFRENSSFLVVWNTRPHFQLIVADPFFWFSISVFNLSFMLWRPRKTKS